MLDTTATFYGYSAAMICFIGLVLVIVAVYAKKAVTPKQASILKVVGAVTMLLSVAVMAGVTFASETAQISGLRIDVSGREDSDQTFLAIDNGDNKVTWNVHFNYSGDGSFLNSTNTASMNFTLLRLDSGRQSHVVECSVSDKGSVVDEATGNSYYLVNKGSDWNVNWTKAGSTEGDVVETTGDSQTLKLESGGSAWTTVTIVLRADAIDAMPLYEAEYFYLDFAGQTWTVVVTVITYAGTPPTA